MSSSPTATNPSRRRPALRGTAALTALLCAGALAACGGSGDDDAATTAATAPDLAGPELTDADQRVVSVLLGFVRATGEQARALEACADDACRDQVAASLAETADAVEAELDAAGEPSECIAEVADALGSAAEAARDGGDDVVERLDAELSGAARTAQGC